MGFNLCVLLLFFGVSTAFAGDGSFTITNRVVLGYENNCTYSFSKKVTKNVCVDAKYVYTEPQKYTSVWKDNELHVEVVKKEKILLGLVTRWSSVVDYKCDYNSRNESFTLKKPITISSGVYAFIMWRNRNEAFWNGDQKISAIKIKGTVSFK